MSVRRLYVEKKEDFRVKAWELKDEIIRYLGINSLTEVRVLIRYDIENLSDETYKKALGIVFSEPPVDDYYENSFPVSEGDVYFSVEYLPGQFDQRADSAEQCIKLLNEKEEAVIRSATTYVFSGNVSEADLARIKDYCVNPVDS
ncbi:MAG: phosphoribosylformylglycinamidine synthase, partial [Lachnospiraceae bacterium]|nr:phosphoribosylformylglycinamidine synthase [Lachnospiraceae bacterium]